MSSKRIYTKQHILDGIQATLQLRRKQLDYVMPGATQGEDLPEVQEGYCLTCKGKSKFEVEETKQMPNGAYMKKGKCTADGCGTTVSAFVAGTKDAA